MAIIQISKVQARSGNLVDLPQLDQGEFGWASDYGLLYIGKTATGANVENIEVLTSYSNISFSQVDGAEGNLNISNSVSGQVLTYDGTNWVNAGGNALSPGNSSYYSSTPIHLGNVSTVKIGGGGIGYVLETDGTGNLNWTPKGTLYTSIIAISSASTGIMTVANTTPYTNGQAITITGVQGTNANTVVNGQQFYIKLAVDFATTGNVELYTTSALTIGVNTTTLTATANTGIATAVITSGSGSANAGGAINTIQFNNGGVLDGSANLTFNGTILAVTGNANVTGNVNVTSAVRASTLVSNVATGTAPLTVTSTTQVANLNVATAGVAGTVTTAAQPNITSTGTLVSLSVSGNANIGNIGTAGLITATGNLNAGNIITAGIVSATGNGTFGNVTATLHVGNLSGTGNSNVGNLGATGVFATTLSSTGNANVGNLGTSGLITATGNITGGNLVTAGVITATGNANVGNLGTGGLITATGNITGGNIITAGIMSSTGNATHGNIITGGLITATGNANVGNVNTTGVFATTLSSTGNANVGNLGTGGLITATGNITGGNVITAGIMSSTGNATHGNIITGGLITATGNITGGNLITGGVVSATGNGTFGNVSGGNLVSANYITGTLTTAAQPNITSLGTLTSVSVSGNANIGNIGTGGLITATGNITGGNLVTGGLITATGNITGGNLITGGVVSATGNANIGNIGTGGLITATGNITGGNLVTGGLITSTGNITGGNLVTGGVVSATGNANVGNIGATGGVFTTVAGSLTTAAQPNVTSVSTSFTNLTFANAQTISGNNITLTTGANTNVGTITGNWSLSTGSRLQATYADLAEYYEADAEYEPGTVLQFGGDKEVTLAEDSTNKVAGVISTNPAYAMNAKCPGIAVAIALQGRVPCKVRGKIHKGDMMISGGNGFARPSSAPIMGSVIGKSLENFDGVEGIIEIAIGRL